MAWAEQRQLPSFAGIEQSMRAAGAPDDVIAAKAVEWAAKHPPPEPIEVFPENVDAFRVFWLVRPQWEHPGANGGRCTVPFQDVDIAVRRLRVRAPDDCFERVSMMLLAARQVFIARHERALANRPRRGKA